MAKIILSLLDNGIDYIYEAVEPIFKVHDNSRHSWKYSVLHLYSGIELLLKEKLRQEHWSLIFQDISGASSKKFESGDFVSVYHDDLVKRLQNISKIAINDEPIKRLRDLRNRFEHFEVKIALNECEQIVAAALDEIIKFWEMHLKFNSTVQQQERFKTIKSIATEFEVYRGQRLKRFKEVIDGITKSENGLVILCPDCSSLGFAVFKDNEKECKCFVCDERYKKYDYLRTVRRSEEDSEKYSLLPYEPYDTICPSCQQETRVRYKISDETTLYCCLNCLNKEEQPVKEVVDSEFEKYLKRLENATGEEVLKTLAKRCTSEEIYQLLQARDCMATDSNPGAAG
jgi:hypothetical protein